MKRVRMNRAVSLVEVVVSVAALGIITATVGSTVLKPKKTSLSQACLVNLQRIGQATQMYADEDPREQIVPIHMNMVRAQLYWEWRTVQWFGWGGQGGTEPFMVAPGAGWLLDDAAPPPDAEARPAWAAARRPLNPDVAAGALDVFHCPADVGYPSMPVEDDSPRWNANRPCWSTLGNSYRANMCSIVLGMSGTSSSGAYALGPWGHARSTLSNPSRLVLAADPLFYSQVDPYPSAPDAVYRGWHNSWRKENALFCDGSARATSTEGAVVGPGRRPLSSDGLGLDLPPIESGLENTLEAGPTWQVDGYPTPGAVIFGDWHLKLEGEDAQYWPWLGGYTNP